MAEKHLWVDSADLEELIERSLLMDLMRVTKLTYQERREIAARVERIGTPIKKLRMKRDNGRAHGAA